MAIQMKSTAPSSSQWASAAAHLDRQAEWRTIRIDGVRYVILTSASSGRTYTARADARGCSCRWYSETGRQCSHLLALELAALEDDLREDAAVVPFSDFAALYPPCVGGCGNILDSSRQTLCDDCSAIRARQERMAAARSRVLAEMVG